MAAGPLSPFSVVCQNNGNLYPAVYAGAGGNASSNEEGMGVIASLAGDSTWYLRFAIPTVVPSGTAKLRIRALANATSGAAKMTVSDAVATPATSPSSSGNPSLISLTSESQTTVTWAASENDRYKAALVTLTPALTAGDILVVALTFQASGWTLAAASVWWAELIWA